MFSSRSKLIVGSILMLLILSALAGCARVAAALWVFFGKGVEIRCSTGSFEVQFDDGTTARDQGVLYVETRDLEKPYHYTRDGGLILSNEPVGKGEPLRVLLFVPSENLGKKITKVAYMRDS